MDKTFGAGGLENQEQITQYVYDLFNPEDAVLTETRERSNAAGLPKIQVGQMDGLHLEVLTRAFGARKAVEIGTLGGYSGVCIARGMGPQGKLYTFEYEPKHADVARQTFAKAGIAGQVELFVGAAIDNLPKIESQGPFDLVFIDADKVSYPKYLAWAGENLRVGGVVLGDNTFAWGGIAAGPNERFDDADEEASVRALQKFNREAAQSGRFRSTILPTGEGLTVAVKVR